VPTPRSAHNVLVRQFCYEDSVPFRRDSYLAARLAPLSVVLACSAVCVCSCRGLAPAATRRCGLHRDSGGRGDGVSGGWEALATRTASLVGGAPVRLFFSVMATNAKTNVSDWRLKIPRPACTCGHRTRPAGATASVQVQRGAWTSEGRWSTLPLCNWQCRIAAGSRVSAMSYAPDPAAAATPSTRTAHRGGNGGVGGISSRAIIRWDTVSERRRRRQCPQRPQRRGICHSVPSLPWERRFTSNKAEASPPPLASQRPLPRPQSPGMGVGNFCLGPAAAAQTPHLSPVMCLMHCAPHVHCYCGPPPEKWDWQTAAAVNEGKQGNESMGMSTSAERASCSQGLLVVLQMRERQTQSMTEWRGPEPRHPSVTAGRHPPRRLVSPRPAGSARRCGAWTDAAPSAATTVEPPPQPRARRPLPSVPPSCARRAPTAIVGSGQRGSRRPVPRRPPSLPLRGPPAEPPRPRQRPVSSEAPPRWPTSHPWGVPRLACRRLRAARKRGREGWRRRRRPGPPPQTGRRWAPTRGGHLLRPRQPNVAGLW